MTSVPVSPLYEPGAPPLPIPLLSAQTSLSYDHPTLCTTAANEMLHPSMTRTKTPKIGRRPASSRRVAFKSPSPTPDRRFHRSVSQKSPSPSPSEGSSSSDQSENSNASDASESSSASEDEKITKPPGEPGRPESGGYNLEAALNWTPVAFKKLKKRAHFLIDDHLDTSKNYSSQKLNALQRIRQMLLEDFPDLEMYYGCWPVNDIIKMRLKNTSANIRRQGKMAVAARKKK